MLWGDVFGESILSRVLLIPPKREHLWSGDFHFFFRRPSHYQTGLETGRRVRIVIHGGSFEGAFATDGALSKVQGGELSGDVGGGDCSPINTAEERTRTWWEGLDEAEKGGVAVVCESTR